MSTTSQKTVNEIISILPLNNVLSKMANKFSSHEFITEFMHQFEGEYINMLTVNNKGKGTFRNVHSQIGKYLSLNTNTLNIKKDDRDDSQNIFDHYTENQFWVKIN